MRKDILSMMAAALLVVGLTACGGVDPYPFKDISEMYTDIMEKVKSGENNDEMIDEFFEKKESWCKKAKGKTIKAEVDPNLGLELVDPFGTIESAETSGMGSEKVSIEIIFDVKIVDIDAPSITHLYMAVVESDDGEIAAADDISWKIGDESVWFLNEKVKNGDVVKGSIDFRIRPQNAASFKNASKIVIRKNDDKIRLKY